MRLLLRRIARWLLWGIARIATLGLLWLLGIARVARLLGIAAHRRLVERLLVRLL